MLERSPPFGDGSIFLFGCKTFFHILQNVFAETLKPLAIDTLATGKTPKVAYLPDFTYLSIIRFLKSM